MNSGDELSDETRDALEMMAYNDVPVQGVLKGFTPLMDVIAKSKGVVRAAVFGKVWRYCQMADGVCRASVTTIANGLGMERSTVQKHLQALCDDGYLEDKTPGRRNSPHVYKDTRKVRMGFSVTVDEVTPTVDLITPTVDKNHMRIDSKRESKKEKPVREKTPRMMNPTFEAVAQVCGPEDEVLHSLWVKENAGWIAKVSNNGAKSFPSEKILEWFSPGGWWYSVRCKGMDAPRPTPETITKNVALAAAWDKQQDSPITELERKARIRSAELFGGGR